MTRRGRLRPCAHRSTSADAGTGRANREVDPDGRLLPKERAILVRNAAKRLSVRLNAAKARARRTFEVTMRAERIALTSAT
jgi:hypothetical protein